MSWPDQKKDLTKVHFALEIRIEKWMQLCKTRLRKFYISKSMKSMGLQGFFKRKVEPIWYGLDCDAFTAEQSSPQAIRDATTYLET